MRYACFRLAFLFGRLAVPLRETAGGTLFFCHAPAEYDEQKEQNGFMEQKEQNGFMEQKEQNGFMEQKEQNGFMQKGILSMSFWRFLLGVVTGVVIGVVGCRLYENDTPRRRVMDLFCPPGATNDVPPQLRIVADDKATIEELRAIWGYERDFSLRNKKFAKSISELGDGSGVGKDGYCLRSYVWDARYDKDNASRRGSPAREDDIRYFYRLIPRQTPSGEAMPLSVAIAAIPEKDYEPAFVALCGPVDLENDFSFNREWKVYKFANADKLLAALKSAESISEKTVEDLLPENRILIPGGFFPTCFN